MPWERLRDCLPRSRNLTCRQGCLPSIVSLLLGFWLQSPLGFVFLSFFFFTYRFWESLLVVIRFFFFVADLFAAKDGDGNGEEASGSFFSESGGPPAAGAATGQLENEVPCARRVPNTHKQTHAHALKLFPNETRQCCNLIQQNLSAYLLFQLSSHFSFIYRSRLAPMTIPIHPLCSSPL